MTKKLVPASVAEKLKKRPAAKAAAPAQRIDPVKAALVIDQALLAAIGAKPDPLNSCKVCGASACGRSQRIGWHRPDICGSVDEVHVRALAKANRADSKKPRPACDLARFLDQAPAMLRRIRKDCADARRVALEREMSNG